MTVFLSELRQYRRSLVAWAVGFAIAILFLYPVFESIIAGNADDRAELEALLEGNPTTQALGVDPQYFFTSLGVYALLIAFLLLPAAVQGAGIGLGIITKENVQNTADFLLTKPISRAGVYLSKGAAAMVALFVTSTVFLAASLVALIGNDFAIDHFVLLFLVFPLVQLFFLVLGMTIGTLVSRLSAPLPVALGIAFVLYVVGMFASVAQSNAARAFSPYKYFPSGDVLSGQGYAPLFVILYVGWLAALGVIGFFIFVRKDVPTAR
ncbi:ABC transporter permease [Microbacterium sp. MPKO10]|uniref:ABC transporter permease n=1 Tax=Microbacterium sp. MPKO10 TaxID=2989818 RepID=UPI00223582A5|nr:ABC transporter permease [Microbacterium sp. MPKO10]MCW4457980.1 ABC transporter permease [Microbacterium sp. MPKO10]